LSKSGDFKSFFPQNLATLCHFCQKKSFVKVALDFYFFRQKIKRTGTTIHQNIENKKSIVVAM
jgi:hypothetical protein